MSVRERKERERLARRETILAAAAQVFAKHGVDGATVEMVARQAEVAVGTIYLYFFSRDDLFVSLMAERIGKLRELRQLREENSKLTQLVADLSLDRHILQEIVQKKL